MSTLIVKVQKIDKIEVHPNADTLSILQIGGWQVIAKTEGIEGRDKVLYIPIDAIADKDHPLLSFLEGKRVKTIKLRGIVSQGLCVPLSEVIDYIVKVKGTDFETATMCILTAFEEESNLAEFLNIRKYEPPVQSARFGGQQRTQPEGFDKYTNIEHFENYNRVLRDCACNFVVTEKLHGTSARFGIVDGEIIIGSRNMTFAYPQPEGHSSNVYIDVFIRENIQDKLNELKLMLPENKDFVLYGEIAGPGVQGKVFKYGVEVPSFFLYDIKIDGKYLDWIRYKEFVAALELRHCPVIAADVSANVIQTISYADGKSCLDTHIKEGVVVKPIYETFHPRLGRVVLKMISKQYLLKDNTDLKNE